ncbi:MAG: hypothetical protein ABSD58_19565 [Verrucomicrobiia bacterium]|jgi:hypothetical protein
MGTVGEDAKAKLKLSALAGRAGYTCARVMTSPRFAPAVLVTVLVWEFGVLLFEARRKLFVYDELLTFHVSSLQPFSSFWRALKAGVDGMPLGYYLLVRAARILPGDPHIMLRLPSVFGYLMTLLGVYWFARKRLPAIAGLVAAVLIALSPFRGYALEARSYSLLVGFLAISAILWQRIDKKRFMTPLFAVFLTLAVSCHHLAVVAISSFGIAELTWTLQSRRIRWGVWAACLLATSPFFMSLPILLHYRDIFGKNFWSQPDWDTVISTYGSYLGLDSTLALVLIAFFGIVVGDSLLRMCWTPKGGLLDERDFGPPEIILVGGFLYFPALLVVLTKLLHSGYTSRYGLPAILGLVLGSVYLVRTIWLKSSSAYLLVALLIAFAYQGSSDVRGLYKAGSIRVDKRWTGLVELSRSEPSIPVVVGSPLTYLEAVEYSPPELRDRLVEVVDADVATRVVGTDTADKTNRLLAQFIPLHVEDLAAFQAAHQKFILLSGGRGDWFTQYLIERGYHLRLLGRGVLNSLYIAEP